jgi:acid phosphatase (class A)
VSHRQAIFSGVAGVDLEGPRLPLTRALLEAATHELVGVLLPVKTHYARPRPYDEDPRITPAVRREPSFAYPSGHAAWGMVVAGLLAELAPARREAILERGRQVGNDRVLGGVHHPSDVVAGQRLGETLVALWLQEPAHRRQLENAKAEW